ncbi:MAG: polysaccharide biosynthesis protein [Oscillospiraceae bacterium]|nr:polysaccharide biosynthesis protein [Oscillospiraceae bacterium]
MQKRQTFLQGAAILAVTAAIVKVLGALYKIPLGWWLSKEGFAHFDVAYRIYALLLTISVAGLPTAMSRMISGADAVGNHAGVRKIFTSALWAFLVLGVVSTLVMFFGADSLALIMGDADASLSIAALAPAVICVCFMGAYRGFSQGLSDMLPTSVTQVLETAIKMIVGLGVVWYLRGLGYGSRELSAGAIIGVSIGSAVALLYMIVRVRIPKRSALTPNSTDDTGSVIWQLFKIGVPMALGASVLNIIGLIDSRVTLTRLTLYNPGRETSMYGAYAMAQNIANIPSSFIMPITMSLIPAISARLAQGDRKAAGEVTGTAMKLTLMLGLPCAIGLSVLSHPVIGVIYPDSMVDGAGALMLLGISSFFVCTTLIENTILQARGLELVPVFSMLAGAVAKIASTHFLTPHIGVMGGATGSIAGFGVITIVNFIVLKVKTGQRLPGSTLRIVIANAVMGLAAWFSYLALERALITGDNPGTPVKIAALGGAIVAAILVYVVLVIVLRVITRADVALMPKGDKIARILRLK